MRIIGLDPGLRNLGWGIIDSDGSKLRHVEHGVILSGEGDMSVRLARLFSELTKVLEGFSPIEVAVEETFVNTNASSTLKLGQARSVCLLAPGLLGLKVAEYAPNSVKKALVGQGHAAKGQVGHMVSMLLSGVAPKSADATDALAIAICHAHHRQSANLRIKAQA
ncbi:MAG: crossover junction endodeoxyribonuclease RuvC [Pseudomonadota bacterium]